MKKISVIGGTGYAGANIVAAGSARGFEVTAFARHRPAAPVPGVRYEVGSP
jgi:putative NADH-flavin reductase